MLSISGYGRSGPLAGFRAYASNINNFLGLTCGLGARRHPFRLRRRHPRGLCRRGRAWPRSTGVPAASSSTWRRPRRVPPSWPRLYLDYLANGREWSAGPNEVPGSLFSGVFACGGADAWVARRARGRAGTGRSCARSSSDPTSITRAGARVPTPSTGRLRRPSRRGRRSRRSRRRSAAGARPGRRSRAEQRGPVARPAASQPRAPSSRSAIPTSGVWSIRTPRIRLRRRPARPRISGPTAG